MCFQKLQPIHLVVEAVQQLLIIQAQETWKKNTKGRKGLIGGKIEDYGSEEPFGVKVRVTESEVSEGEQITVREKAVFKFEEVSDGEESWVQNVAIAAYDWSKIIEIITGKKVKEQETGLSMRCWWWCWGGKRESEPSINSPMSVNKEKWIDHIAKKWYAIVQFSGMIHNVSGQKILFFFLYEIDLKCLEITLEKMEDVWLFNFSTPRNLEWEERALCTWECSKGNSVLKIKSNFR